MIVAERLSRVMVGDSDDEVNDTVGEAFDFDCVDGERVACSLSPLDADESERDFCGDMAELPARFRALALDEARLICK